MDAVHVRHGHVEDDDVRLVGAGQIHRLRAVAAFADDRDARLVLEDAPEALADERMVVGQHDTDSGHVRHGNRVVEGWSLHQSNGGVRQSGGSGARVRAVTVFVPEAAPGR